MCFTDLIKILSSWSVHHLQTEIFIYWMDCQIWRLLQSQPWPPADQSHWLWGSPNFISQRFVQRSHWLAINSTDFVGLLPFSTVKFTFMFLFLQKRVTCWLGARGAYVIARCLSSVHSLQESLLIREHWSGFSQTFTQWSSDDCAQGQSRIVLSCFVITFLFSQQLLD